MEKDQRPPVVQTKRNFHSATHPVLDIVGRHVGADNSKVEAEVRLLVGEKFMMPDCKTCVGNKAYGRDDFRWILWRTERGKKVSHGSC